MTLSGVDETLGNNQCDWLEEPVGDFTPFESNGIRPTVVAAIIGVLLAGGWLQKGEKIAGIFARKPAQRWKWAGIMESMRRFDRNVTGYRKS